MMKKLNIWVEVTTLVLSGQNDSEEELRKIAGFLAGIDKSIPWHLSRFYPQYKMEDLESTPLKVLDRAYEIGKEAGLRYVYLGNVGVGSNTYCHECHHLLIERLGYSIKEYTIREGRCLHCKSQVDGVGL